MFWMDIEMKNNIFVSYTVRDNIITLDFLRSIEKMLLMFGTPFIDLLHNDSINKQDRIEKELAKSNCLILINTILAKKSNWVIKELSIAKDRNIPIYEFEYNNICLNQFQHISQCITNHL